MNLPKSNPIQSFATQEFSVTIPLTESEARVLLEITKYGSSAFCDVFKKKLGSGLDKDRATVEKFFETIKRELPPHLSKFERARKIFKEPA